MQQLPTVEEIDAALASLSKMRVAYVRQLATSAGISGAFLPEFAAEIAQLETLRRKAALQHTVKTTPELYRAIQEARLFALRARRRLCCG